ncbi:site-2 protease family protein [Haloechinothrix salitolerans]|uniref:Site-2 protease family protein n=1 Tax=Haloechinothrix salitolerans TaxID=926830 RepID=A0ABW2BY21_9PSEU
MQRSAVRPSPIFLGILATTVVGGVLATLYPPVEFGAAGIERHPVTTIGIVLLVLGGWALSLTLHEFGHAIVAYRGGDVEVAAKGYLTMDVRRYTDPVLSLVLPLLLLAIGGIPLPGGAVWINHWALRSRRVAAAVSLAGPLSNLTIGILLTVTIALVPSMPMGLLLGLSLLALLQIVAFVLNIMPVPGLDGYGALEPYLSPQAREIGMKARPWAPLALFALLIAFEPVRAVFFGISDLLFEVSGGDPDLAYTGLFILQFWR